MKKVKMALDCLVTDISGTQFADGTKAVKISLEDFTSFNVRPDAPVLKKLAPGTTFDCYYANDKENESGTPSGGTTITYHNLQGVRIVPASIKQGAADEALAKLEDVFDPEKIVYRIVGTDTVAPAAGAPVKV